jgi:sigma-E factor negative regulatory protein RseA
MNTETTPSEQLSALFDGELPVTETRFLLRRMEHDRSLPGQWSRHQALRGLLRNGHVELVDERLCAAIAARINAERAPRSLPGWLKPAAGFVIAAGVAALALLTTAPNLAPNSAPVAEAGPRGVEATGLSARDLAQRMPALAVQPVTEQQILPTAAAAPVLDPRLETYFLRHSNAVPAGARGGFVPYVYVVATPAQTGAAARNESH